LAQKLRQDQQRLSERVERAETRPMTTPYVPQPAPAPAANASGHTEAIESAAKAAIASAMLPISAPDDVTIRPMQPKPSLFPEPVAMESQPHEPQQAFIPPAPDRTGRPARAMPRIEDLPVPAQNELRAMRGEAQPAAEHPEKRRMGLLQRLASVGLGRREESPEETEMPANPRPALRPVQQQQRAPEQRAPEQRQPMRPVAPTRPTEPRQPDPVSEYAKRPSHQGLDPLGRQAPVHNSPEEDQLEIPAFLRRQAT
ncbi:MAG TPA: hypothetical protein VEK82_10980, partial [Stellaceae bacterium]|nr:hypothetical protein [Stellaceae bacterium]